MKLAMLLMGGLAILFAILNGRGTPASYYFLTVSHIWIVGCILYKK